MLKCPICLELKPPKEFKFFPCGHGFCAASCVDELLARGTSRAPIKCPYCREFLRRGDAHKIYLDIASPQEEQTMVTETLTDGLSRMDKDAKAISVTTAEKKLRKFAETLDSSKSNVLDLIQAVQDFKDRIIPVFKKAEEQSREIEALKARLESCQANLVFSASHIGPLEAERDQTRAELLGTIIERDTAINFAKQATEETVQLREELKRATAQETFLQESRSLYKMQILAHKDAERKQIEKIDSLKRRLAIAQQEAEHEREARLEVDLDSQTPLTQRSSKRKASSPSRPPSSTDTSSKVAFFEAMPRPRFGTDWNLPSPLDLKKRKPLNSSKSTCLKLDGHGRPIGSVQIGSKSIKRIPR
ncbi:hypothetical protein DXG01_006597 [Tephrocybe rancida]|nr:hypothetical protein DXG01_006597 [Tephrocybe rancida]